MPQLQDKTAIITGSSAGIGKGIALLFARLGAHVVVTSRTQSQALQVAEEIMDAGGVATPCAFDIDDPGTIPALLAAAQGRTGRIDILVNNALSRATTPPLPLQALEYQQLRDGVTANLTNVLALTAAAYPALKAARGVVLNIGSAVVNRHTLGIPLYTIFKGALSQTTRVLAAEWAMDGIRVNQINPGFVSTDSMAVRQTAAMVTRMTRQFAELHPLGRVGEVEDIASLAAFLVSTEAGWITGAVIDSDGGYSVQGARFPAATDP
jgi:3-oxoacyl-[acyl-carrier protein] reductase